MACGCDMDASNTDEQRLLQQLVSLAVEQTDEQAVVLMELAEVVAEDPAAQAAYLQRAYNLRLKSVATAIQGQQQQADVQQQQSAPTPAKSAAVAGPSAATATHGVGSSSCSDPVTQGEQEEHHQRRCSNDSSRSASNDSSSSSSGSSNGSADWDASDDWQPDLSRLRNASSFERQRTQQPAAVLQPFASQPHAVSGAAAQDRSALSEPSRSVRAASSSGGGGGGSGASGGGISSSGGGTGAGAGTRPRGRGQSKLGLPTTDSEDEALQLSAASLPHIVELHGLTRAVTTTQLEAFLADYMWGSTAPNIKWVDEAHALAVFPCAEAAAALLEAAQRQFKVRPYSRASKAALHIPAEELTPPRAARPKTTTAVARRLISNALGNREVRDRAAEKELADLRRANKEGRQQRQQQLDAAWGDE